MQIKSVSVKELRFEASPAVWLQGSNGTGHLPPGGFQVIEDDWAEQVLWATGR